MGEHGDVTGAGGPDDGARAVARTPPANRRLLPLAAFNAAYATFWTWRIAAGEHGRARVVVLAVAGALLVALVVALAVAFRRRGGVVLRLDETELRLERRVHPVAVRRRDVLAVRGDVPGRPTWSEHVLVQTPGGILRLPPLDQPPGVLVPLLQEWAGVEEQVPA